MPLPAGGAVDRGHGDGVGPCRCGHPVGVDLGAGHVQHGQDVTQAGAGVPLGVAVEGIEEADERVEGVAVATAVVGHQVGEAVAPDVEGQLGGGIDGSACRQPVPQGDQLYQPGVGVQRGLLGPGLAADAPGFERVEPGQG